MIRWMLRASLVLSLVAAGACGGGDGATKTSAEPTPANRPAADYVREVTPSFDTIVRARERWEGSSGRAAVREATQGVLDRERDMLEQLRGLEPPAAVRDQHERMVAVLESLVAELEKIMAAERLDTDAADTQVGRLFELETVVSELYRFG